MSAKLVVIIIALRTIYLVNGGDFIWKDGYQYYISYPLTLNWHNSFRYCTYQGMYLIDFHTELEFNRTVKILEDHRKRVNITGKHYDIWTSGTELGSKGKRYWETTGHSVMFTKWAPNEPNNWENIQDCIALFAPANFLMIDRECNKTSYFVCRNKLILADTLQNKNDVCVTDRQIN